MPWRLLGLSAVVCVALILATAWLFELSLERAAVLAPLLVVTAGTIVGLIVLWTRIALDPLIRRKRERT
jgi:hypothetical protein